jgi:hypothetical protein
VPVEELDALAARTEYAGITLQCPTLDVDTTKDMDTEGAAQWVRGKLVNLPLALPREPNQI